MGDIGNNMKKKYQDIFTSSTSQVYLSKRNRLYAEIFNIVRNLKISSLLDIGCAYGILVELCNTHGINAFGVDFPIDNLREFHDLLKYSKGKFVYGCVDDKDFIEKIANYKFSAIVILDSLRFFEKPENLNRLGTELLIIKEVSNNFYIVKRRKSEFDIRLYSPSECLKIFPEYYVFRIYSSRFLIRIDNPNLLYLNAINLLFPSYTIILRRKKK